MSYIDNMQPDPVDLGRNAYQHPMFRYLTNLIPRRIKSLFRLCEFVFTGPHANAAIRKIAEYPITEPEITAQNTTDKETIERIYKKVLYIKRHLVRSMYNLFVYGNDFTTFYRPFNRFVRCGNSACNKEINIRKLPTFKYKHTNMKVHFTCPECNSKTVGSIEDKKLHDISKCNIIHWNPRFIDIDYSPINGESQYYYQIPPQIKEKIIQGNEHIIRGIPIGFLEAIRDDVEFLFDDDEIFHMKMDGPAGLESETGWGIPPLLSVIETYLYISLLRKGNESVALERIESFRIVYPSAVTPNGDPSYMLSQQRFTDDIVDAYEEWRRGDRNLVMFSTVPAGVTNIGGDARPLLTQPEIEAGENTILAALGIPREFLYGGFSYGPGSAHVLRQIENQLTAHISQTEGFLQWITQKVCEFIKIKEVRADLGKVKIQDDVMLKQLAMNLWQAGEMSSTTLMHIYGMDREKEKKLKLEETLDQARSETELQKKLTDIQNDIAQQAQMQAMQQSGGVNYDVQSVLAEAENIVNQMMQMDPNQAKSLLSQLENEDFVMYSVVAKRWEQAQYQAKMAPQGGM